MEITSGLFGIDQLRDQLKTAGLRPRVLEPTLFLSRPQSAAVMVGGRRIEAWPATFARSTGATPVEGVLELIDDVDGHEPLAGTIALVPASLTPDASYSLERRGAVAQVFVEPTDTVRPRSCSTIWGAPTHESVVRKPRTPVVMVGARDGEWLRNVATRKESASVFTDLSEGWTVAPLLVVDIHGVHDAEEFVLVHGSDDDVLVRLARECHAVRGDLARSIRVAWWPDRLLGSAVGSSWYADTFAAEIDEWCVAHLSVGGDPTSGVYWMAEAAELCLGSIAASGLAAPKGGRPPRDANYSFNQIGVTGFFGGHAFPASVYAEAVIHVAKAAMYPFDYSAPVLEMGAAVQRYQAAAGHAIDFSGVSTDLARLRREIGAWRSDAETALGRHPADWSLRRRVNATLRGLARVIVPLGFAKGERFDHDPALGFSALPRLEAALHLPSVDEPMRSCVRTALVREANKVQARLRDGLALLTRALTA